MQAGNVVEACEGAGGWIAEYRVEIRTGGEEEPRHAAADEAAGTYLSLLYFF